MHPITCGAMGTRRSTAMRTMLFLALVLTLAAAVARTAMGDVDAVDGGGGGEEEQGFLRLPTDGWRGGTEEEDRLMTAWEDDDDEDDEEDELDEEEAAGENDVVLLAPPEEEPEARRNVVSVDSFGAAGDGSTDDTEAFSKAWEKACSMENAVFLVPRGRRYRIGVTKFLGPCQRKLNIEIQGTLVAPEEPSEWDPRSPRLWLLFGGLVGARIQGGGLIDGSGSKWWANSCKINKANASSSRRRRRTCSQPCKGAPTAVTIDSCRGVVVRRLHVQNAQQMHVAVSRSRGVRVAGLRIAAPEDSPNTDGIHVSESSAVTIRSCNIGTGDDCISISNATFDIRMKNILCGPGHGISIGSLGKDNSYAAVENVVLDTARISRAQNGVRIKTWQGGAGYVRNVRFSNVRVDDVDHPIIIDQFYCDSRTPCHTQKSNVQVSNVAYSNISGTSRRAEAIKFACSDAVPCRDIVLRDVDLLRGGGGADEVQAVCNCAMGFNYGRVRPAADCLSGGSGTCGAAPDEHPDDDGDDDGDHYKKKVHAPPPATIRHTEL
ncbi:hypothetical protein ACP4OV_009584 [Aristida adscensionis]